MTDNDLKKMNRKELLELLIALEEENNQLKNRIQELTIQLESRDLQVKEAGNLADAVLALNGVFECADRAAAQYLEIIEHYAEQQKSDYDRIVSDAEQKATQILENADRESRQKMNEADAYWQRLSVKLEAFYQDHAGLQELLSIKHT